MLSNSYGKILSISAPLMLGTFIQSIVMITDASFLSRYSTVSFDASGNAGLIYVTLFMGLTGLGDAGQIVMARRIGQNLKEKVNGFLQSNMVTLLFFAAIFYLIVQFVVPNMLLGYSKYDAIAQEQVAFLSIRSIGFFVGVVMLSLNAFFMAIGKTWVIMLSTALFAGTNILLDKLLIFGFGDVPAMGIEGAALASVIAEGVTAFVLIIALLSSKKRETYQLFAVIDIKIQHIKRLLHVGFPLMIQGFFALATWTVFFTWIEQTSAYDLTVSQNIRAVYFLAFVPIFGFGATTKTYIAQYMDQRAPKLIPQTIQRIQLLTMLFLLLIFHGALLYPEALISMINPKEAYLSDSADVLRMVFGSILIFGFTTPYFQTINGSGNTRVTMIIEISAIVLYIIFAYLFIKVWQWHIYPIWSVEYIYFGAIGLFSVLYLRFFDWRKKEY
ncbi:MAG: MATE family efflux transporter [Bacteroidota bacterium]